MTPNPNTIKFVSNKLLVEDGKTYEFTDPDATEGFPLIEKVFNFPFVDKILLSGNYLAVTKNNLIEDWQDVVIELREFVQNYLRNGGEVMISGTNKETLQNGTSENEVIIVEPKTEVEKRIVQALEDYVLPAVERDGGMIYFKKFEDGVLTLSMRGACQGCPSSMITLKNGIETLMKQMIPEVKEVIAD
ncbi:MAG: NifU family protein [Bacteroidetes bacterium]|nr:MAG: NifU family protein [Bacteroidota bacterium]